MIDGTLACEDATQNLLRLWLLLMLMLRKVLMTVCCRFGSWSFGHKIEFLFRLWAQGLVKIKAQARFRSWILVSILLLMLGWDYEVLVEILKLGLVKIMKFKFSRNAEIWLRFFKLMLGWYSGDEIWSKFVQELWYDKRSYFGKQNSTLGSVLPLAMFDFIRDVIAEKMFHCFSHARDTCLVD